MPLPTSGQISFADLNSELGNTSTSQLDLDTAAIEFSIPTKPHGMDEFYGLTLGTLSVDPTSFTFNLTGGYKDFTTTTRSGNTVVTDNQAWLSISGRTNSGFRLTATTQVIGSLERSGTVTVSNDTDTVSIPITQNAYPATLTMTPNDNFNLNASGTGIAATISSNTAWSFSSVADWINISLISSSGNKSITISADPQVDGAAARTDDIILSTNAPGGTNVSIQNITVSQEAGAEILYWETNPSSLSFETLGGTQYITLTTSYNWTAAVSGTGFSINTTSGTAGTQTISVTATQKDLGGSGTVTFSATGQTPIVVSLSQAAAEFGYFYYVNSNSTGETESTREINGVSYLESSISIGVYAYRGDTPSSTEFGLEVISGGAYAGVGINTSQQLDTAYGVTSQFTGASASKLYINLDENGSTSSRTVQVELTLDSSPIAMFLVEQQGNPQGSGGGGGGGGKLPGGIE